MEPTATELQSRVLELETKVQSLDRQIRSRNSTLACVLAASGGSIRIAEPMMKQVLADYAGATFRTEHDTASSEYVVSAEMISRTPARV